MKSLTNELPCAPSSGPFPASAAPPPAQEEEEEERLCFRTADDSHFPFDPPPCPPLGVVVDVTDVAVAVAAAAAAVLGVNAGAKPAPAPPLPEKPPP